MAGILWLLIRLRYKMMWAQARTNGGRIALFVGLYVLGVSLFLFLTLGGIGAAVAAVRIGRGEEIARWLLTGLFVNGITLGIVVGVGPRAAFCDEVLRRYPLAAAGRFIARHLTGLLDPVWPILFGSAVGLAIGFDLVSSGSIVVGTATALAFTITTYLCAVVALSLFDRALQHRIAAPVVGAFVSGLFTIFPALLASSHPAITQAVDRGLRLTPPGVAGAIIAGLDFPAAGLNALILIAWMAASVLGLAALERRPTALHAPAQGSVGHGELYEWLASPFKASYAPLIGKSLRYHLRSNRVRIGLFLAVFASAAIASFGGPSRSFAEGLFLPIVFFFIVGISSTAAVTLNQFGYDHAGIRRYAVLPAAFVESLRAGSIVSLVLGGLAMLAALVVWILATPLVVTTYLLVILLLSGIAGLFIFNALGLLTSVLAPRTVDFRSVLANPHSAGANVVMVTSLVATLILTSRLIAYVDFREPGKGWWLLPLLAALGIGFYFVTFRLVSGLVLTRRDALIKAIAGASTN